MVIMQYLIMAQRQRLINILLKAAAKWTGKGYQKKEPADVQIERGEKKMNI